MKVVKILILLAALGGMGYGSKSLYESDLLLLKRVEVIGNSRVSANEVVAASKLEKGTHLLKLSTHEIGVRVGEVPWILQARIERILPSKVRITVEERQPVAVVLVRGEPFIVDRGGFVLASGAESFVTITELPITSIRAGADLDLRQFDHALKIYEGLPSPLRSEVRSIKAASVDRITLELNDSTLILYGAAESIEDKNFAIEKLLANGIPSASIDVRVPHRPAVRPR
ncbi:MAG: FtsQ-type POTRA domain-containing protein [Actinomycetota bacterium]